MKRAKLTVREKQVLKMVQRHLSNKQVANALGISYRTVEYFVSRLLIKFGVKRRYDL